MSGVAMLRLPTVDVRATHPPPTPFPRRGPPRAGGSPYSTVASDTRVISSTMDFGLFFLMQRDDAWSEQAVYDSALEQMLAAESLGYQSVWIAEHHFNDYGLCPTPPVLASFIAARTA